MTNGQAGKGDTPGEYVTMTIYCDYGTSEFSTTATPTDNEESPRRWWQAFKPWIPCLAVFLVGCPSWAFLDGPGWARGFMGLIWLWGILAAIPAKELDK